MISFKVDINVTCEVSYYSLIFKSHHTVYCEVNKIYRFKYSLMIYLARLLVYKSYIPIFKVFI